jgi:large subunit ribosomal protein L4
MKTKIYTIKAEEKSDFSLPKEYEKVSASSLLAQAVRVYEDGTHFGLHKVKTRSEVNITKKKIYKQKGTGGARHGAKSAHIFVGGGVVHGPSGLKRTLKMTTNMKKKALLVALSNKFDSKKAVIVEGLSKVKKTSEAAKAIELLKKAFNVNSKVLVVLPNNNVKISRFYKNIKNVETVKFADLNAFLVIKKSLVLVDGDVFEVKKESQSKVTKEKVAKKVTK